MLSIRDTEGSKTAQSLPSWSFLSSGETARASKIQQQKCRALEGWKYKGNTRVAGEPGRLPEEIAFEIRAEGLLGSPAWRRQPEEQHVGRPSHKNRVSLELFI